MKYSVQITESAIEDMKGIIRYVSDELYSPEAAQNLYDKLNETIFLL